LPKGVKCRFLGGKFQQTKKLSQKTRKGWISKKLAPKSKKLELNSTNLKLNFK
jgi:hypothetical protein